MRTKLIDLNDILFEQLDRLSNDDLKGEALEEEINRAKAVVSVTSKVIENATLILDAHKVAFTAGKDVLPPPLLLGGHGDLSD